MISDRSDASREQEGLFHGLCRRCLSQRSSGEERWRSGRCRHVLLELRSVLDVGVHYVESVTEHIGVAALEGGPPGNRATRINGSGARYGTDEPTIELRWRV